jgi:arginyl-tRNA synthetase
VPPNRALGDLAVTVAFQLARALRKAPRAIAQELAQAVGDIPGVARIVPAPNGYLNLYLDRYAFFLPRVRQQVPPETIAAEKTIVEHTAINPNKAAHIGHLRNAALGDTIARVLRFRGLQVEVQNYIDDLGVQVADILVGFMELEHRTLAEVREIADTTRFDYYCWDLYSRVTEWYGEDSARLQVRARALHDLEHGGNDAAAMASLIVERIVRAHLATMARLNIGYDLLTYEGDIIRLQFWTRAFEILKAQGAVFLQTEGKLAGCWVMKIEDDIPSASADAGTEPRADEEDTREKVIVRSNGVVTYIGKDLANQFWKLGLWAATEYRLFATQAGGRPLWSTTSGVAIRTLRCSPRGAHLQRDRLAPDVPQAAEPGAAGARSPAGGGNSIHFSHEMVALSHATARQLGYETAADSDEARKPFVEVSGRKGLGVKIDDLLDLLVENATAEVQKRNPDFSEADCAHVGRQIGVAAIRYFMLKFSRGKLIVFDMAEALSFEGETGPYLQYAVVRANNIFHKLREREGLSEAEIVGALDGIGTQELADEGDHSLWAVVFEASRLDDIVEQVVRTLEFSVLAKYAFGLAQLFNAFYHRAPILGEEDLDRKRWRAAGVAYVRSQLTRALDLMGIDVPTRM